MSETLEQIALRVAKEVTNELELSPSDVRVFQEFARRLVAVLGAQEPVAWAYTINKSHSVFSAECPPADAYDDGTLFPLYAAPETSHDTIRL